MKLNPTTRDLTGVRFGRLVPIAFDGYKKSHAQWRCRCDCGTEKTIGASNLMLGRTESCGCLQRERAAAGARKHGRSTHPIYHSWWGMRARCYNKSYDHWSDYGGRGIKVCPRWRDSFENFLADMGASWAPGLSVDRINNDGDYSPENCRWATRSEQVRNTRRTRMVTIDGVRDCISAHAERLGVPASRLVARLKLGWSEDQLSAPKDHYRRTPRIPK